MKTIIVGAVQNYGWRQCEVWYRSLRLSGFEGEVHLIEYPTIPLSPSTATSPQMRRASNLGGMAQREKIIMHQCELKARDLVVGRFLDLANLCKTFPRGAWVVFTDVGDIVFQRNPEAFLESVPEGKNIVAASEGIRFKSNEWVRNNMLAAFPDQWEAMKDELLYNAGSIAARAGVFAELAANVYAMCMDAQRGARFQDQAALNCLLRHERYARQTLFTRANDGWCFCAASSTFAKPEDKKGYEERPAVIRGGRCYVEAGEPVMFHHYSRDKGTKLKVERCVLSHQRLAVSG